MSQTKVVAVLGTVLRVLIKSLTDSVRRKMLPLWIANLSDASASSCTASNSAGWSTRSLALSAAPRLPSHVLPPVLFMEKPTVLSSNFWVLRVPWGNLIIEIIYSTVKSSNLFLLSFVNSEFRIPLYSSPLTGASQPDVQASVSIVSGTRKDK